MILGAIYVVFFATDFLGPFQGFLITLGVPIAAWCGIFVAEVALRRRDYAEADLYDPAGRYGNVRWVPIGLIVLGTVLGWGLVTNTFAAVAGLAGLPARPGRRPRGRVGVREPGRAGLAAGRLPRHPAASRSAIRAQEAIPA